MTCERMTRFRATAGLSPAVLPFDHEKRKLMNTGKIGSDIKSSLTPGKIIAGVIIVLLAGTVLYFVRKTAIGNKVVSTLPGNQTAGV